MSKTQHSQNRSICFLVVSDTPPIGSKERVWTAFSTSLLLFFFPSAHTFFFFFATLPQPGIELVPPGLEAQSPNHWTSREDPLLLTQSSAMHSKLQNPGSGVEICYLNAFVLQMRKLRPRKGYWWGQSPTVNLRAEAGNKVFWFVLWLSD